MTPVIQLEAIDKTYHTGEVDVKAVRGVSLSIHKGEFVAFMGSSVSGKSTLMNLIGCLDRPTGGRYLLDGIDVSHLNRDELATVRNHKLGFVFQSFNLLARTSALENVELPLLYANRRYSSHEMRERAERVLSNELSGGQQQRVAIARALINDPEVLLADEPTGNLDSRTSIEIMNVFQRLNDEGITVIMVTHEPDIASYCKRNIVMRDGRIQSDLQVVNRLMGEEEMANLDAQPILPTPVLS